MNNDQFRNLLLKHNLINPGETIIVGVSSGPDSMALLALLHSSNLSLTPVGVYVDHGLRPTETPDEIKLVKTFCQTHSIDYEVIAVDVAALRKKENVSVEAGCRRLRYEALEKCRVKHDASTIAVAHTASDQAEEVLLRLFRGSGLKGLSGMRMKNRHIIRPLLTTPKDEVLRYLKTHCLSYCKDSSNNDLSLLRNRLRLDVLPQLTTHFNQAIQSTLCQTAQILQCEDNLIETITKSELTRCVTEHRDKHHSLRQIQLGIDAFLAQHTAIQRRIIEHICWQFNSQPRFRHIETLRKFAQKGKTGTQLHLPLGLRVLKGKAVVTFLQPQGATSYRGNFHAPDIEPLEIRQPGEYPVTTLGRVVKLESSAETANDHTSAALVVDADKLEFPLKVRAPKQGEKFRPAGMPGRKKIGRFLSDLKIPRDERNQYPVLTSRGRIVAVMGLRADHFVTVTHATTNLMIISWNKAKQTTDAINR